MTIEKEDINLFYSDLIAELKTEDATYRLFKNRIQHVIIHSFSAVGMEIINTGYEFLEANGGGKFFNIFQFDSFSDIQPEIRDWAADPDGNNYTISDAIVIDSLSQKIIADFYLKFNKPGKPTKVFYSLDKAIEWTLKQVADHKGFLN